MSPNGMWLEDAKLNYISRRLSPSVYSCLSLLPASSILHSSPHNNLFTMKSITVIALLAATVYGGFIQQLPKCVRHCARDGLEQVGCKKNDKACFCSNLPTIENDELQCSFDSCGQQATFSTYTLLGRKHNLANASQTRFFPPSIRFATCSSLKTVP